MTTYYETIKQAGPGISRAFVVPSQKSALITTVDLREYVKIVIDKNDVPCESLVNTSRLTSTGFAGPRVPNAARRVKRMDTKSINTLLIEDNADDATLIARYLNASKKIRYNVIHFDTLAGGLESLKRVLFDVILLDLSLPDGPVGIKTFETVYAQASGIPIIVLTGHDDDDLAVEAVHKGAQDYLVKGLVTGPALGRAIRYAIERTKLLSQLERSMKEIKQLRGILPICANCKKIRDDKGYWTQVEVYISAHSGTEFSHGICPDCAHKLYPQLFNGDNKPK